MVYEYVHWGACSPIVRIGHQMHMRHKTAATRIWIHVAVIMCRPIWICVAAVTTATFE